MFLLKKIFTIFSHCSIKIKFIASRSDEGEWLKALEDGEVDERGYLPKRKGRGNLTARQASVVGMQCTDQIELPNTLELPL